MTTDLFQEADTDTPPVPDPITPKADPVCVVCDVPLDWSGKGFRPKYCADHKRGGKSANEKTATGTPAAPKNRNNAAINRAISSIELLYGMTGTALQVTVAPTIGRRVVGHRQQLAESYRALLETNAQVRKWFAEAEGKAAWLPIVVVHADFILNTVVTSKLAKAATARTPEEWEAQFVAGAPINDPHDSDIPPRPDGF